VIPTLAAHSKKIPLLPTPLEIQWMCQTNNIPTLTPTLYLYIYIYIILHNINKLKHITHPNGTHLTTNDKFKHYHKTPTKIVKTALGHARALFYETS